MPKSDVDKRPVIKDEALRRRTRWAINFIAADRGLTNLQISVCLGMNEATLGSYRVMKTSPKARFIKDFCNSYGFNESWLLNGHGEPFPGARAKFPDVCGPEPAPERLYIKEGKAAYAAGGAAQKMNIDDAMGKTYIILSSGTPYAVALYLNIQQFSSALNATTELKVCQDRIADLQDQVDDLRRQVEGLTSPPASSDQQADSSVKEAM